MRTPNEPEIVFHVERLNSEGQGIAIHDGLIHFIDGALPSETIRGSVFERKKKYARAQINSFDAKSPDRTEPECVYFEACGGCQLMHMRYEAQLRFKTERVRQALQRIGGLRDPQVRPCLGAASPLRYRNKLQLHARREGGEDKLGFFAHGSHSIVPIADCLVHHSSGQALYSRIRQLLEQYPVAFYDEQKHSGILRNLLIRSAEHSKEMLLVFVTLGEAAGSLRELATKLREEYPGLVGVVQNINPARKNTILGDRNVILSGNDFLTETFLGLKYRISTHSFFQVNTPQAEQLFQVALDAAQLSGSEKVLDAFSGTGVLALSAASRAQSVVGIEVVEAAVADANKNAAANGIKNAEFLAGPAEKLLKKVGAVDVAFLDPPRKGCEHDFLAGLCRLAPQRIIYVSCDPATLARDVQALVQGGYKLDFAQPLDMFPQTIHVESVALLTRNI